MIKPTEVSWKTDEGSALVSLDIERETFSVVSGGRMSREETEDLVEVIKQALRYTEEE